MSSKNSTGETYGKGRTRNFTTVVYPESAPEDWQRILSEKMVPAFISPLHDKDINYESENKEQKKPHYHVMLCFDSVKTLDQAREITTAFGGVGCEAVNSVRGCARYLCHLDNPDKFQYNIDDVICLGGADYTATIGLPTDKYKAIGEMMDWCDKEGNTSYAELLMFARMHKTDWFRVLCDSGTMVMKEFLKSREWEQKKYEEQKRQVQYGQFCKAIQKIGEEKFNEEEHNEDFPDFSPSIDNFPVPLNADGVLEDEE